MHLKISINNFIYKNMILRKSEMKVVQINAVFGIGSTGVIVKEISSMLNRHNIENYIFYASGKSDYKQASCMSNKLDMKVHALLSRLTGKQAYFSKKSTQILIEKLDNIMPDVVHLHNLHNNYINLNMLLDYLANRKIKTVITLHDCWYFTGKCTHYHSARCNKWQAGCKSCSLLKADNPSWFFDRTNLIWHDKKNHFEKINDLNIVSVSEWMAKEASRSFLKCGRISVIHNGVDTKIFDCNGQNFRKQYGLEDKFVILGMANKWLSKSNAGLLEYILNRLNEDCCILLLGANSGHRENKVIYLPYISNNKKLAALYRTADVFVNVTHEDSLPTVNLEAMACGTPVITYDVCGSSETVNNRTGIVVAEGCKEELSRSLFIIKSNGRSYYATACREHILTNYSSINQFEEYMNIYSR